MKNLVHSKSFKNFMAKLYGFGASVVIVGAMFKIMHWPGSGIMLVLGLSTEAVIFFFSAFEPPHQEPDWTLVYPELAGLDESMGLEDNIGRDKRFPAGSSFPSDGTSQALDKLLEEAKIGPELIESLGSGFKTLSENASKMADITNASVASEDFANTMKGVTKNANELSDSYKKTSTALSNDIIANDLFIESINNATKSAETLTSSYNNTSEILKKDLQATEEYSNSIKNATLSAQELSKQYNKSTEVLTKTAESIQISEMEGKEFSNQLQKNTLSLSALNNVYELQLQLTQQQVDNNKKVQESMNSFFSNLNDSIESTNKYKEELMLLTKNISALNNVYGNMLSAMNVNINK